MDATVCLCIMTCHDVFTERITGPPNYNPHAKRPSRAVSNYENLPSPSTPTASSLAEALLNSAVEDEQKKVDSSNGSGTPKQSRSASNVHGGRQASVPPLQKSSSMSSATRPAPKM